MRVINHTAPFTTNSTTCHHILQISTIIKKKLHQVDVKKVRLVHSKVYVRIMILLHFNLLNQTESYLKINREGRIMIFVAF